MNDFPTSTLPPLQSELISRQENEVNRLQSDQYSYISKLSPEILVQIFSSLNLKDRKNVRLVCVLWNHYCSFPSITKNEKIVFKNGCKLAHISEILQRANDNRIMNLEFHDFSYPNHIEESIIIWQECGRNIADHFKENNFIWQKRGGKIVDLRFFNCDINKKTFKSIFLYANNLKTFSMEINDRYSYNSNTQLAFMHVLDFFEEQKIEHTQLRTFDLRFLNGTIRAEILHKIFIVFPCLKEFYFEDVYFNFGGTNVAKYVQESYAQESLVESTYSLLNNYSSHSRTLEFLADEVKGNSSFMLLSTQLHSMHFLTLKGWENEILQFFSVHKNLVSIALHIDECSCAKELLFHILQNCTRINKFSITQAANEIETQTIIFNCEEILKFLIRVSKIHDLELTCVFSIESLPLVKPLEFNANIVSLSSCNKLNDELLAYILERGPNIEHLRLYGASDPILQKIFKNLRNLKTLILDYSNDWSCDVTPWGFKGPGVDGVSIAVLQKLDYLEIAKYEFTEELIIELSNPSYLKYLKLTESISHNKATWKSRARRKSTSSLLRLQNWESNLIFLIHGYSLYRSSLMKVSKFIFKETLLEIVSSLSKLEILRVPGYYPKKLSNIITICSKLKKLNFLEVASLELMALHPLFMAYTDLKYVSDEERVFWFNSISGEMCDTFVEDFRFYDKISPFGWSRT